jgi:hypothetical protein
MAITSLNKYTVPLASNQSSSTQGLLMPKLKYRFRVILQGFGATGSISTELTKQVMDITRPKVSFEEMEIPVYNSKVYLAGKYTWETMTLTLRDDASGNVQRLVGEQIQKQFDFMEQAAARSGIDYKFTTKIEILDGGNGASAPTTLETFEVYGCFIQNADYGEMNYGTNEPATVALTIRFDNAVQYKGGQIDGIGRAIGQRVAAGAGSTGGGSATVG